MLRTDFVSNSSSSSFVVICHTNYDKLNYYNDTITLPTYNGHKYFGWEFEKHYDFFSKLNFCALLVIYAYCYKEDIEYYNNLLKQKPNDIEYIKRKIKELEEWHNRHDDMKIMLSNVCRDRFNLNIEFNYKSIDSFDAFIDHQSNMYESPDNARMFDNEDELYDFLASKDSYIATGNDNSEPPEGEGWYA
jgi:hypothetical protein